MKRLCLSIIIILISFPSFGQDVNEQRKRKEKIEEEISLIDKQLDANKTKKKQSLNSLILTQKKISNRKKLISQINKDINSLDKGISSCNGNINRLSNRLDTLMKYHSELVLNAYKMRDTKVWFMYIFTGENLGQGLRRWSYLKNISASINEQAREIQNTKASLEKEKNKLKSLKQESVNNKNSKTKEYDKLKSEEKKANQMISKLSREEWKMKDQLKKKQKEIQKLNAEIERILAATVNAQKTGKATIDYKLSSEFAENKGKLPWPVEKGIIIEKFGQSYHPVFKNLKLPFNNGINISAAAGSEAKCIFNGIVKQILIMPGYNQCVLVQHGEYFTFYCKLQKVTVKSGDKIKTGDTIGIIGNNADGNAEIHFQLWKGTDKQDPEKWLR